MSPFELNNNDIMSDEDIKEKIQRTFYQLENGKEIREIMDFLTENQKDYPEYNGWIWLQGKLIYKPEIIFIGYNPPQEFQKKIRLKYLSLENALWHSSEKTMPFSTKKDTKKNDAELNGTSLTKKRTMNLLGR